MVATDALATLTAYDVIHIGSELAFGLSILVGGWRYANSMRDTLRDLQSTVYGSERPPVEGLVDKYARHDRIIEQYRTVTSQLYGAAKQPKSD